MTKPNVKERLGRIVTFTVQQHHIDALDAAAMAIDPRNRPYPRLRSAIVRSLIDEKLDAWLAEYGTPAST